jgi:2'-5' RNA ligase
MIRLFVALELPGPLRQRLALMGGGVPGARWQREDQFHLTLRFIGEVQESTAADIDDALSAIRAPRFFMELAGVGEFGGKVPRALWAGVRVGDELQHLQRKIEAALQRLGLPAEERKFSPHVTLARMKGAPRGKVMEFLTHHALFSSGPFEVEHFALFSSQTGSGGSVYHVEREYPLT